MTNQILQHLKLEHSQPSLAYLQGLINAYCTIVPWESISKILKKANCKKPEDCVRLENEFWTDSLINGTGGTCYESNWAFYKLLRSLGFNCYLTINKVVDKSSVHSAIIVTFDNSKYIADVGYPLYAPIPIHQHRVGYANHQIIAYSSTCITSNEYVIENFPHPKPYLYHLTDSPVDEDDYLRVSVADYCDEGLFLNRIIIRKLINNTPTRFDSDDLPYNIHQLQNGTKIRNDISQNNVLNTLSNYFGLDLKVVTQAFDVLKISSRCLLPGKG